MKADCNTGSGKYSLSGSNLKLEPGTLTRAACAPDSLSDKYLARLADVVTFVLQGGKLVANLKMDAGNMVFRNASAPAASRVVDPSHLLLDTQGLPYPYQPNQVPARAYDKTQPPAPSGLPAHVQVNFGDTRPVAVSSGLSDNPVMYIVPVEDYLRQWDAAGDPSVRRAVEKLQAMLADRSAPIPAASLPVLPSPNGANDLAVQAKHLDLGWAGGVRFVGRFVPDANPVTNVRLYYVFQGFTGDGKSFVALFWPVRTSALPDDVKKVSAEEIARFSSDPTAYMAERVKRLNTLGSADWDPDLDRLDALLGSAK